MPGRSGITVEAEVLRAALACALGYVAYGLYQVADGALQIGSGVVVVAV